ncbi:Sodium-coupled neutral amino acid transporter [Phytophthora megakarya]|uniref:Sodium-coupled neutral amino acid transporter n=1 Tax=Phytophthora megakarya TaxID=4795 RepID=A0A225WWN6_9STRA|nr:Sodium-coupled neutral amino acid transporter [Phytophthora megakarya]
MALERMRELSAKKLLDELQDDLRAHMRREKDEFGRDGEKRASVRRKARIARLSDPLERERIWSREQLPSYEGADIRSLPKTRDFWREVDVSTWRKDELDVACMLLDLPANGKKMELIARIQDWVHEPEILARLEEQRLLDLQQDAILEIESLRGARVTNVYSGFDANFAFARTEDGQVFAWGGAGRAVFDEAENEKGECFTWGRGEYGELGTSTGENEGRSIKEEPIYVETLKNGHIVTVSVGNTHTAAITDKGRLYAWVVSALEKQVVLDVCCGSWHTLCIARERDQMFPVRAPRKVLGISAPGDSSGGFVYAFGSGLQGQLGLGKQKLASLPSKLYLTADGNLYTWGQNFSGCLGRKGSEVGATNLDEPGIVDRGSFRGYGVGPIVSIAAGHNFTLLATGPWEPREEPSKLQFQMQTSNAMSAPPSSQGSMIDTGIYRYERNRASHEFFSPGPHATTRTATAPSAIFNLVSTIIGGGILSLPFAFDKCGLVVALVFMAIAASASTFSLYVIVFCSRRGRAASYEEVVRKALGARAGRITVVLLVVLTLLTLVAYVILTKDLVGSLGAKFLYNRPISEAEQNMLTVICVLLVSPALLARSMDALRFTSIFSLVSVLVLAIAITVRAVDVTFKQHDIQEVEAEPQIPIKLVPDSWADAAYAFPIISVSFLCHFNVLPVYRELHKPTRHRLKKIVASTMFSTWLFYMLVGIMGYLFAFQQQGGVQGDILNNFSDSDHLVNLGRLGLLVTIQLSLPLIIQPCRANLLRLAKIIRSYIHTRAKVYDAPDSTDSENEGDTIGEGTALLPTSGSAVQTSSMTAPSRSRSKSTIVHVLLTVGIMTTVITVALLSPGVAVVWNLMGSTVGLLISYVLPCVSYVCIRREKPNTDRRKFIAWVILAVSSIVCTVCTIQAFTSVFSL